MRLINTKTGKFVQILDPLKIPPYAILSHTWENLEQSYQDVVRIQEQYGLNPLPDKEGPIQTLPGSPSFALEANSRASHTRCSIWDAGSGLSDKIRKACEIAHRDGYHYIWIDSCCIDKTSSSELSEAINSMFNWYRNAQICYAFLSDVPSPEDARRPWVSRFRGSRWFRRGWTLQELIAPRVVVFVSEKWDPIGTKDALAKSVEDITHIDRRILTHEKALADESVAERMRWAARRETTRVEDQAYSLLGIFGISMPTLYGEGMYAFRRLQEEILQRIPDQSLFAWGSRCLPIPRGPAQITVLSQPTSNPVGGSDLSPFAPSPQSFNLSEGRITRASGLDFQSLQLPMEEYIPTPHGIRTKLYLLPLQAVNPELSVTCLNTGTGSTHSSAWHLAVLKCQNADIRDHLLSRLCYLSSGPESNISFLHVPKEILIPSTEDGPPRIHHNSGLPGAHGVVLTIPLNIVCAGLELKTVYLTRPTLSAPERRIDEPWNPATFELSLPAWIRAPLQLHSYSVSDIMVTKGRTEHPPAPDTHSFTILNASSTTQYRFQFRYAPLFYGPDRNACIVIEARVWCPHSVSSARPGLGGDVHNNTVHPHPPYASAIWADEKPWAMDLPLRSVKLPTSGPGSTEEEVQLQLGLDLVAPGRYNIHIRVPTSCHEETTSNRSTRGLLGGLNMMNTPHTEIELTMLGTVRRELEAQGYSVHLKRPNRKRGSSGSHSGQYSLIISNSGSAFSISIDYFHVILARKPSPASSPSTYRNPGSTQQDLLIAARVALRSSSPASTVTGSEMYLDGPYVAGWSDQSPWQWCLQRKHVSLTTPNGEVLTLHLGLDLAWQSEYYLLVNIQRSGNPSSILGRVSSPTHPPAVDLPDLLDCLDHGVSLTLPGHVERALQEQGFGVRFRRAAKDDLHSCRLTLSHGNQVTVGIDFSNHLVSRLGDGRDFSGNQLQELTFRACVKLLSSSQSGHPNDASHTASPIQVMEWVAWRSVDKLNPIRQRILKLRGQRRWHLPCKDVKLMLPSGFELTLRLGLYLVWPPEYCLIVEIIPPSETSHGSL